MNFIDKCIILFIFHNISNHLRIKCRIFFEKGFIDLIESLKIVMKKGTIFRPIKNRAANIYNMLKTFSLKNKIVSVNASYQQWKVRNAYALRSTSR